MKQGLERGIDGRETRREWRLTGSQTVADSVLPAAKKSAATGKTPCGCSQKVCDYRQNWPILGHMASITLLCLSSCHLSSPEGGSLLLGAKLRKRLETAKEKADFLCNKMSETPIHFAKLK